MSTNDFCNWLKGFLEVVKPESLTLEQIKMIEEHLNLALKIHSPLLYLNPRVIPNNTTSVYTPDLYC